MKRLWTLLLFFGISFSAVAQELSVKDFHHDPSDISAVRYEVKDYNGEHCALLKIGLVLLDVTFEGSILKQEFKDGEWWVYMADGAWWLNIKTKKYLPLRYEFPEPLQKKSTYILQIEAPQIAYTGPTGKMLIESNVKNADVFVDGEKQSSILPYEYIGPEGEHYVEIMSPGYNTERMTFTIELQRRGKLRVNLKAEGSLSVGGISYEMVNIPGGTFMMGYSGKTNGKTSANYEKPVHSVQLRSYLIGKTEVTQGLWKAVMGSNPSLHQGDDLPVENVSWYDVQDFILKLNALSGKQYRLPTEAEWEFAARGASGSSEEPSGGKLSEVAVVGRQTAPAATRRANAFGLYDMSGNVAEWCSDWLSRYSSLPELNPTGPEKGVQKIVRGGAFSDDPWFLRTAYRGHKKPADSDGTIGFRLAQDL